MMSNKFEERFQNILWIMFQHLNHSSGSLLTVTKNSQSPSKPVVVEQVLLYQVVQSTHHEAQTEWC